MNQKLTQQLSKQLEVTFNPTKKQYLAFQYLQNSQTVEILFGGGAGGAKTFLGCTWLLINCIQYPKSRWLLGREQLTKLKKSTVLTFLEILSSQGFKKDTHYSYNQQENYIRLWNGSEIYLVELRHQPSDPDYSRIGSTEFSGGFIDEVNEITQRAKEVVKSRLRFKLDEFGIMPKLLMSCNPSKNWVYLEFYKPHRDGTLPEDKAFIQALARDNPYLPKSYLKTLSELKDKVLRERLWFGNWEYEDDDNALFNIETISDLFTNTVEESDKMFITCDVARKGKDKTVVMVWKGLEVIYIETHAITLIPDTVDILDRISKKYKVQRSHEIVDEDGVGGGVVDIRKCRGFVGGSSPLQKKQRELTSNYKVNYQNLRAQCYYTLSEYVQDGKIRLPDDNLEIVNAITEELEQIKSKDSEKLGKLKIIGKDEIKEHIGRSPDYADGLMMRMLFEIDGPKEFNIEWV